MYYLQTGRDKHDRLRNALLLAVAVHAALVLGVTFRAPEPADQTRQIEVTLSTRPTDSLPENARHLAANNQLGGGEQAQRSELTSREPAQPAPPGATARAQARQAKPAPAARPDPVSTRSEARLVPPEEARPRPQPEPLEGVSPELDRLQRELASLQAELDEHTRAFSETPRVRRLDAVSAQASADAAYLLDWRRRLEAVGNKYYPEASVRYGMYGDLRLLVVVRKDGSLEDIRVLASSGYAVLDEAAIKIVRMAAPFAPFPAELRATTDKLEIVRTWQFRENPLSSD